MTSHTKREYRSPRLASKKYFASMSYSGLCANFLAEGQGSEAEVGLFKPREIQTNQLNIILAEMSEETP